MKKPLVLAACVALFAACDYAEDALEDIDDPPIYDPPDPVAFSSLTLLATPLPADEDGSSPDLHVEIQDASGGAVYESPSVLVDAEASDFPYRMSPGGELVGTTRPYVVVVLDRDADGYDRVASTAPFTADSLRASPSDTFAVANAAGTLRAELVLRR